MRGKMGLHDGLQRCNVQRAALACVGEGSREYRLPIVGNTAEAKEASEQSVESTLIN